MQLCGGGNAVAQLIEALRYKSEGRGFDVAGLRPPTSWVHYTTNCNTQSSAPEDG